MMRRSNPLGFLLVLGLIAGAPGTAAGQSPVLVDIRNLSPRELRTGYFALAASQDLQVEAVGGEPRRRSALRRFLDHGIFFNRGDKNPDANVWPANAWILDARTRQVAWELRTAKTERGRGGLRIFEGAVRLPAGIYEVHYAALFPVENFSGGGRDWRAASTTPDRRYEGPYLDDARSREFRIVIRGSGARLGAASVAEELAGSRVLFLAGAREETRLRRGFELDRPSRLEVYGVGEAADGVWHDHGWINEAASGRTVWTFANGTARHAGGGEKNRAVRSVFTLPAGRYLAHYVTDASHHPGTWNQAPPYDPSSWGLALLVGDPSDRAAVRAFDYRLVPGGSARVALSGLSDDELRAQRFAVGRALEVRIVALGEGTGGEMHDYGWIADAAGRSVWKMQYAGTQDAGGSSKNRLFNGTIRLEPGRYTAYFVTDGSHSFGGGWNGDRPFDAELWGMSILLAGRGAARDITLEAEEQPDPSVLARLVRVGDGRLEEERFRMARDGDVRVVALGEGDGEMYDYAWIEDAAGTEIWRMGPENTEHAGGAEKNRRVNAVVHLARGEYVVRYRSDGSHSFADWTADPPDDPLNWGVTVYRVSGT